MADTLNYARQPPNGGGRGVLRLLCLLGATIIVPIVVLSAYLFLSRWPTGGSACRGDSVAFTLAILVGAIPILMLRIRVWARGVLLICYVPAAWFLLLYYALAFVGFVFDEWL